MNATKKGADMSLEVVKAALENNDGYVTIGGGEPTLHPEFYQILCLTIAATEPQGCHVITNGKIKDRALVLAKMAKGGTIGAELSVDEYHEAPDPAVYQAFKTPPRTGYGHDRDNDMRGIRTVNRILARGRGKKIAGATDECACPEIFVDPKGDVYLCGCKTMKIGDVFKGWEHPEDYESGECAADLLRHRKCGEFDPATQHEMEDETPDGCRL
jgi:MoaA/NifB/PqqE/SkfB family radical SAM enzyme